MTREEKREKRHIAAKEAIEAREKAKEEKKSSGSSRAPWMQASDDVREFTKLMREALQKRAKADKVIRRLKKVVRNAKKKESKYRVAREKAAKDERSVRFVLSKKHALIG